MIIRLLSLLLLGLPLSCSSYRYISQTTSESLGTLKKEVQHIDRWSALKCSPTLYAELLSRLEFAQKEYSEKNYGEAKARIAEAQSHFDSLQSQMSHTDGCDDYDGDFFTNTIDPCPYEREDRDGFKDEDGCPDPDNDSDGIFDLKDRCPNAPETINQILDDDGCPESFITLRESFPKNSTQPSLSLLKEALLKASPLRHSRQELSILVFGSTMDESPEDINTSRQRGAALMNFLLQNGLNREQMRILSYQLKEISNKNPVELAGQVEFIFTNK